jgi:hypothetical protein
MHFAYVNIPNLAPIAAFVWAHFSFSKKNSECGKREIALKK